MKIIKQSPAKGFVLIEILLVMFVIILLLPKSVIKAPYPSLNVENLILLRQLEAIARRKTIVLDEKICPMHNCWFNPKGNINKPVTINFDERGVNYELVIWLGFGRFKIEERVSDD